MAVYAISDLHLALSVDKPMDIFGIKWSNYMNKIKDNWGKTVGEEDFVIIPGDISWATYLEQAIEDFKFIERLPGKKIISKGNHDYWWTTLSKLNRFLENHELNSISFLHNNSYQLENYVICGTRGWKCPGETDFSEEDLKIYNRELQRLEMSLKTIKDNMDGRVIITALHYPPFNTKMQSSGFIDIMESYNVKICLYGHLHGEGTKNAVTGRVGNIDYRIVSADYLGFQPLRVDV